MSPSKVPSTVAAPDQHGGVANEITRTVSTPSLNLKV